MTLLELLKMANEGYPERGLEEFYTPEVKINTISDTLALFVVQTIVAVFSPEATDEDQLDVVIDELLTAVRDLEAVIDRLEMEQNLLDTLCPKCGQARSLDCVGGYFCEVCDKPCPHCDDGGGPVERKVTDGEGDLDG